MCVSVFRAWPIDDDSVLAADTLHCVVSCDSTNQHFPHSSNEKKRHRTFQQIWQMWPWTREWPSWWTFFIRLPPPYLYWGTIMILVFPIISKTELIPFQTPICIHYMQLRGWWKSWPSLQWRGRGRNRRGQEKWPSLSGWGIWQPPYRQQSCSRGHKLPSLKRDHPHPQLDRGRSSLATRAA